jgi:hypothetical protein
MGRGSLGDAPHDGVLARRSILKSSAECHVRFTKERPIKCISRLDSSAAIKNLRMSLASALQGAKNCLESYSLSWVYCPELTFFSIFMGKFAHLSD